MKNYLLTFFLIILCIPFINAQEEEEVDIPEPKIANDQVVFNIVTNIMNPGPKGISSKPYASLGAEFYSYSPLIGKKKKVGLAMGVGVGTLNYNIDAAPFRDSLDNTILTNLPDSLQYKKSKIVVTYWDIPVEIRIRSNPSPKGNSFKFAAGFKFGVMLSNHYKYRGDSWSEEDRTVKFKTYYIDNIMRIRYGLYARLGYGKFTVMGNYYLTPLFEKNKGPESMVVSFGLSFLII